MTVSPNTAVDAVKRELADLAGHGMDETTLVEFKEELRKERAEAKKKRGREEFRAWEELEGQAEKALKEFTKAYTALNKKRTQASNNLMAFLKGRPKPKQENEPNGDDGAEPQPEAPPSDG